VKAPNEKPHFQVTAGLVWKQGRVLISNRREGGHLAGVWEFPGGKQESGESLTACLEREIHEEVGLKVEAAEKVMTVCHEYNSKKITLHVFSCILLSGEARPMEGQEIRWVHPAELVTLTFPPPDMKVIEFLTPKDQRTLYRQ
jgi:mutator protein MutT